MTNKKPIAIPPVATLIRTQEILHRHGFHLKKKFGQNFLTDQNILSKIIETADLTKATNVIEIGPGIGSLTQYLLENAAEVMAFEIDKTLIPILEETLAPYDNLQLICEDVLKADLVAAIEKFKNPNLPIKIVANLPYYITTPILMHFMESPIPFDAFVVMMQKEVADRIAAQPNSKAYGSLSIAVQYRMEAEIAFSVPRTVFVPSPNVDSAILKMQRRSQRAVELLDEAFFFKIVKTAFAHRRKTLWNNLSALFGKEAQNQIEQLLIPLGLSPNARAESLSISDFARLANALLAFQV